MSTVTVVGGATGGASNMSMGFSIISLLVIVGFIVTIGVIVAVAVIGIRRWSKNNNSPQLLATAKIVAKRTEVSSGANGPASTRYYVTFELEGGTRIELAVSGTEYGQLAEGDVGKLEFQGTRYKSFQRGNQ